MLLDWVYGLFSNDLAIDLGTANTLVYVQGKGILIHVVTCLIKPPGLRILLALQEEVARHQVNAPTQDRMCYHLQTQQTLPHRPTNGRFVGQCQRIL